jgi:hypothetical protein
MTRTLGITKTPIQKIHAELCNVGALAFSAEAQSFCLTHPLKKWSQSGGLYRKKKPLK